MAQNTLLYTAIYNSLDHALDDLNALEIYHEAGIIAKFDAAVIDRENGQPHIAKRMDRPQIQVIPEWFGSGALPRKELNQAARELRPNHVALIVVGEPTLEKGLDEAVTKADKVFKRSWAAGTDELASQLHEVLAN